MSFLMAIVIAVIASIGGLVIILSAMLRWLWNATILEVFGLKAVTFWQAVKLLLITMILFGGPTSAVHFWRPRTEDQPYSARKMRSGPPIDPDE
jgi:hypothetical protein